MGERRRYYFGPFRFDTGTHELRRVEPALAGRDQPSEEVVPLTPKATGVLAYLLDNAGQLASKLELMAAVWPDTHVGEAVLKVAIREIRRALEDDASDPTYIVTVHRRGYRFVAEVQIARASAATPDRIRSTGSAGTTTSPRASLPFGGEVPLVGRESELGALERLFEEAASGRTRLVFLRGDAGSGKTALVRAFLDGVRDRARAAEGACLAQRTKVEPFFSLLSAVATLAGTDRPDAMDAAVVDALVRHAPTWVLHLPAVMARVDGNALRSRIAGAGQARMLRELCELLAALSAEMPIAWVIEDAHFADPATLDVLEAVARDQNVGSTLLLVTYRPSTIEGGVTDVDALKDSLLARSACRFLPLPPLAPSAVKRFLGARFQGLEASEELVSVAHRRTAGNPLFLAHLSEDWEERGWITHTGERYSQRIEAERMAEGLPDTLRRMLESQVAALSSEEQQLLEAAAVAGDACTAALLAEVTGLPLERTETIAEHLTARGPFLRSLGAETLPDGSISARFGFERELYRDVCLARIAETRRVRLYRATATWLEATFFGERELSRTLAHCFEHGRVYDRAIVYYGRAAEEASLRLSYREAALLLGRALALAEHLPDGERETIRLTMAVDRAELRIRTGEYLAALSELEDTAVRAHALGADEAEARALIPLGSIVIAWDYERALAHLRRAAERAEAASAPLLSADARGRLSFFELCQELGDVDATLTAMQAGADLVRDDRDRRHFTHRMACMPMALSVCSRLGEARAAFDRARRELLDYGESYEYLLLLINGIEAFLSSGHLGRALDLLDEGLAMGQRNDDALATHSLACIRANAMVTIGDHPQALSVIGEARSWIATVGVKPLGYALEVVSAEALLAAGRPEDALKALAPSERPRPAHSGDFGVPAMRFLRELTFARAELALGRPVPARERLEALVRTCEAVRQRHALARALASWAWIAASEGRAADADHALRKALAAAPADELPIAAAEVLTMRLRLLETPIGPRATRAYDRVRGELRAIVERLSDELARRPTERASFRAQPWVRHALGEPEAPESAASGA